MPLPKITDCLPGLEEIDPTVLQPLLGKKLDPTIIENRLGNLLIYPQVAAQTLSDLELILAVVQKVVSLYPDQYYNSNNHKIFLPEALVEITGQPLRLFWVIASQIQLGGIISINLKSDQGEKSLGTYLRPYLTQSSGTINLEINGSSYVVPFNKILSIPAPSNRVDIAFKSDFARLLGKQQMTAEVGGGCLGLIIDARD